MRVGEKGSLDNGSQSDVLVEMQVLEEDSGKSKNVYINFKQQKGGN